MKAVGLTIGIPGFIADALQAYPSVVPPTDSYLPGEIKIIFRPIAFQKMVFAQHVDLFLEAYRVEGDCKNLVQTRGSAPEYSQSHAQIRS